jgi:acyl-CoA hydrolase
MNKVFAKETFATSTHIVLPNDTNTLNNLMGGQLLKWMDVTGAISAYRACRKAVVTASVGNVSFKRPIQLGDVVTIDAKVSRSFNTSMEVVLDVSVENHQTGEKMQSHQAMYTFVAFNEERKPIPVPEVVPESEEERKNYEGALRRRQLNLILAGKMDPSEATELKALFV